MLVITVTEHIYNNTSHLTKYKLMDVYCSVLKRMYMYTHDSGKFVVVDDLV